MEDLKLLVIQAQTGDLNAYTRLVERFQNMAIAYAHSLLNDFHLSEDACQEAFIQAYIHISNLKEPIAFPSWFRKIVLSCCERIRRKRPEFSVSLSCLAERASLETDPAQAVEEQESRDQVQTALRTLPDMERQVMTLFYMGEYSRQEIADFLDMPLPSVIYRLRTARRKLKERILDMTKRNLQQQARSKDNAFVQQIRLQIEKLTVDPDTNEKSLWLRNAEDNTWISVGLDDAEYEVIQAELEGKPVRRSTIHQLFGSLLENIEAKVKQVRVVNETAEVTTIELTLLMNSKTLHLEALVKDADVADVIGLVLKYKAPLYVPDEIWRSWQHSQGADNTFITQATDQVKDIMQATREEAVRLGNNYIGTEHLLLGMIKVNNNTPTKILTHLGLNLDAVKDAIDNWVGAPDHDKKLAESIKPSSFLLTPRTLKAFTSASQEVQNMDAALGGVEHLMLGILKDPKSIAAQVLADHRVGYEKFKSLLIS